MNSSQQNIFQSAGQNKSVDTFSQQTPEWGGYTLDELRFQRALSLIKLEAEKAKLIEKYKNNVNKITSASQNTVGLSTSLFKRISGKFTFFDYALIGFNLAKLYLKFRKKK